MPRPVHTHHFVPVIDGYISQWESGRLRREPVYVLVCDCGLTQAEEED